MKHELIPVQEPERWRKALYGVDHAFAHTWENCHAMSLTTGHATYLYQFEVDDARIVCPIAERTFEDAIDIVTPFGFSGFATCGSYEGFPAAWESFARERGWVCGYIALNPLLHQHHKWREEDLHRRQMLFVLDLSVSEQELYARLSRSRRRQINAWAASGGEFIGDREAIAEFLVDHASAFFRSRGASPVYALSPETWRYLLTAENILAIGAKKSGQLVGVTVFGHSPTIGDALFDVSLPAGRGVAPALLWEGAARLRALGVSLLNIGGGVQDCDSVAQSKEQYGARALYFYCLKQVYNAEHFAKFCHLTGSDPADRRAYFPPFRSSGAT